MAARALRGIDEGEPCRAAPRALLEENQWRAIRYGLSRELIDLGAGDASVPAAERIRALLADAAPEVSALGLEPLLRPLERMLDEGNCAQRLRPPPRERRDPRGGVRRRGRATRASALAKVGEPRWREGMQPSEEEVPRAPRVDRPHAGGHVCCRPRSRSRRRPARLGLAPESAEISDLGEAARPSTPSWRSLPFLDAELLPDEFDQLRQTLAGLQMAYGQIAQESGEAPPPPPPPRQEQAPPPTRRPTSPSTPTAEDLDAAGRRVSTAPGRVIGGSGFYRFLEAPRRSQSRRRTGRRRRRSWSERSAA